MINENACLGRAVKLDYYSIDEAIKQLDNQLEGSWRLPTRKELESLICKSCEGAKIDKILFPNTPAEPFLDFKEKLVVAQVFLVC